MFRRPFVALLVTSWIASLLGGVSAARAELLWSYSYSGPGASGAGFIATSNTLVGGAYAITGVSGMRGTLPVESLLAAGTYAASGGGLLFSDNLLHPTTPNLGFGGFTVRSGSDLYNTYNTGGQSYELAGLNCLAATCGLPGDMGTPVSFSATLVPSITWDFAYSGPGVSASGHLITLATPVAGAYQIAGLIGERNGVAMNSLLPAGTYSASGGGLLFSDNRLFATDPFLDVGGFTFHAGDDRYNIYYKDGHYYDLAGPDCLAATCGLPGDLGTIVSFSLTEEVPEPGSVAVLGVALAGIGLLRRRRAGVSQ